MKNQPNGFNVTPHRPLPYLDTPLLKFSDLPADWWSIRDAVRGVQIFGGIGSGKTSGSGRTLAKIYLEHGFGGLVLCAKPGEADDWVGYVKAAGRKDDDIVLFQEGSRWQFNALNYESTRTSKGGGLTFNLTELFMTIFKIGQRISGSSAEEKERFWDNSLKRCINRIIDLLKLSGEILTVSNMAEILNTAPLDGDIKNVIAELTDEQIMEWGETSLFIKCLYIAGIKPKSPQKERDYLQVYNYFLRDFPLLDEKVRSTIKEMFLGYAEPFLSGILNDHFASDTNITPEDTFDGKIIIMDFSVKDYLVSGIYAQCLFKLLWQQAVERRTVTEETKPVFLWVDESQYFVNEYDTIFQTTARSSRACTVFLTQNISNYHAQLGGKGASSKVNSLLGNLSTMIFHTNTDADTNEYASRLIGNDIMSLPNVGTQKSHLGINFSSSKGFSSQYMPQVQPREFTVFKTGGDSNNFEVQAVIVQGGREWSTKKNYFKTTFIQNFKNNEH